MVVAVALWFQSLLMADCYLWSIIFNLYLLSKNVRSLRLLLRQILETDTFASGFIRGTAVHSHWHCLSMHIMCKMANDNCDLWILDLDLKGQKLEDPSSWNGLHNHSAAQDSKMCSNTSLPLLVQDDVFPFCVTSPVCAWNKCPVSCWVELLACLLAWPEYQVTVTAPSLFVAHCNSDDERNIPQQSNNIFLFHKRIARLATSCQGRIPAHKIKQIAFICLNYYMLWYISAEFV